MSTFERVRDSGSEALHDREAAVCSSDFLSQD
jgi:hypothetical protein